MTRFLPFALGSRLDVGRVRVLPWTDWDDGTVFGVVTARTTLSTGEDVFPLRAGMFFVAPGPGRVEGGDGLLIQVPGYLGLRQIGGPVERTGRLQYVDGCTDTLLVCPPRLGEPSLNHLHIPPHTVQRLHTHASDRLGVILSGSGVCRVERDIPLTPGMGWWIPAGSEHAFSTFDEPLDVIAWHPDSVFGPTDEVHPMISGTIPSSR